MSIGPAPILALLVGGFHTALFIFLRGRGGAHLLIVLLAAALGAWAGDALGGPARSSCAALVSGFERKCAAGSPGFCGPAHAHTYRR